jgi:hypothetical protein
MVTIKSKKNIFIPGLLGLVLFFLVISVIYVFINISILDQNFDLQFLMPLIVFSGFFIFLVAAMLVSLTIFNAIKRNI